MHDALRTLAFVQRRPIQQIMEEAVAKLLSEQPTSLPPSLTETLQKGTRRQAKARTSAS
jgi:hypothetical protein